MLPDYTKTTMYLSRNGSLMFLSSDDMNGTLQGQLQSASFTPINALEAAPLIAGWSEFLKKDVEAISALTQNGPAANGMTKDGTMTQNTPTGMNADGTVLDGSRPEGVATLDGAGRPRILGALRTDDNSIMTARGDRVRQDGAVITPDGNVIRPLGAVQPGQVATMAEAKGINQPVALHDYRPVTSENPLDVPASPSDPPSLVEARNMAISAKAQTDALNAGQTASEIRMGQAAGTGIDANASAEQRQAAALDSIAKNIGEATKDGSSASPPPAPPAPPVPTAIELENKAKQEQDQANQQSSSSQQKRITR